jgi:hypothetical protein
MTKEKILELALNALANSRDYIAHVGQFDTPPWNEIDQINECQQAITAIKAALEAKDEPVQWGVDWGKDGNSVSIIKRLSDGNIEVLAWEYSPNPPQRTWAGLTDDEIVLIVAECAASHQHTDIHFARAIEAAHGIKGEA